MEHILQREYLYLSHAKEREKCSTKESTSSNSNCSTFRSASLAMQWDQMMRRVRETLELDYVFRARMITFCVSSFTASSVRLSDRHFWPRQLTTAIDRKIWPFFGLTAKFDSEKRATRHTRHTRRSTLAKNEWFGMPDTNSRSEGLQQATERKKTPKRETSFIIIIVHWYIIHFICLEKQALLPCYSCRVCLKKRSNESTDGERSKWLQL